MVEKPGPSDAPKPAPPPQPPTDNSAARRAASAVAGQEARNKPSQVELLKTTINDKVQQAKIGGSMLTEGAGRVAKGVGDQIGKGVDALQQKANQGVEAARNAPEKLKQKAIEVKNNPSPAVLEAGIHAYTHLSGDQIPGFATKDAVTLAKVAGPGVQAMAELKLQKAKEVTQQVAAAAGDKIQDAAGAIKERIQQIPKDERGGTFPQ